MEWQKRLLGSNPTMREMILHKRKNGCQRQRIRHDVALIAVLISIPSSSATKVTGRSVKVEPGRHELKISEQRIV